MKSTSRQLVEKKIQRILRECESMHQRAIAEDRDFTMTEATDWDFKMSEVTRLKNRLREEDQIAAELEACRVPADPNDPGPTPVFNQRGDGPASSADFPRISTINPQLRAFKGANAARDAYLSGLWLKTTLLSFTRRHNEAETAKEKLLAAGASGMLATQNEGTPELGGYLVPPQFENAVITYREQVGVARRLARVVTMGSDTWTGVKQTSGTTVTVVPEEGEIPDTDAEFSRYSLHARKRAILSLVSSELAEDSLPSIMDFMAQDFGHQFALQEDNEFILGDGTSDYGKILGVLPAITAATASIFTPTEDHDDWSELTIDDHLGAMSLVADKYRGLPLSWLCSYPYMLTVMHKLTLAAGGTVAGDILNGVPQMQFLGYPVVTSDRMPTTSAADQVSCLFGAFGGAVLLGERRGIRIQTSEHYRFAHDQIAIKGTTRYDIHVHEVGDEETPGAIVALSTHS